MPGSPLGAGNRIDFAGGLGVDGDGNKRAQAKEGGMSERLNREAFRGYCGTLLQWKRPGTYGGEPRGLQAMEEESPN